MASIPDGAAIPDSKLARAITEFVRDTETELLFNHSSRVYLFRRAGRRASRARFDPELLYAGAMFHDIGLMPRHSSADERFEVDGANAARDFLRSHGHIPKRTLTRSGRRSRCTPRRASRFTCIRSWRC